MAALPYIQFYVADYLADTMHLSTEEHGAYLLLIFNYWQTGKPIPKNRLSKIARLSNDRWISVEPSLIEFFIDNGTEWVHKRIESDLAIVQESRAQRSAAGKASAEARKRQKSTKNKREINDRSTTVKNPLNENATNKEQIRTDTDKYTDTNVSVCSEPSTNDSKLNEPAVMTLPTNKFNTSGELFSVTQSMADEWIQAYPSVDVYQTLNEICAWCRANDKKRKTKGGMKRFINSWLAREQNRPKPFGYGQSSQTSSQSPVTSTRKSLSDIAMEQGLK